MIEYSRLAEVERAGSPAALATVIRTQGSVPRREGAKMLVFGDGLTEGTIGGGELEYRVAEAAQRVIETGRLERLTYEFRDPEEGDVGVCGGEMEVLVEPIKPPAAVVVVGAGHVGQAVVHLAKWLGFHVIAVDDRQEFADTEVVPEADETIHASMKDISEQVPLHEETYFMLTTRGVDLDVEALPSLLESQAAYIGVIGSRRRWQVTAEALRESGVAEELIGKVRSPMGLELNAETPEEIALSMMAEIVMLRRGGTGETMARNAVAKGKAGQDVE